MTDDRKAARVPHRRRPEPGCTTQNAKSAVRKGGRVNATGCRPGPEIEVGAVALEGRPTGPSGDVAVVTVSGEIDLRTAEDFRAGLLDVVEAGFGRIIVDFGRVRFCDATGLGTLVAAHNRLEPAGGLLRLACVRPAQRRLFRITGL